MAGEAGLVAACLPDASHRLLATLKHKHFIRDLNFTTQQRKKVVEVEALVKEKREGAIRKSALVRARQILRPDASDKSKEAEQMPELPEGAVAIQYEGVQKVSGNASDEIIHRHAPAPVSEQPMADPEAEIDSLPAQQVEAEANRLRALVDAALGGTVPPASETSHTQPQDGQPHAAVLDACNKAQSNAAAPARAAGGAHAASSDAAGINPSGNAPAAAPRPRPGKRPMWAVTEEEAEAMEAAEEDCLLDFAEQLDIDALAEELSDAELAQAMQALTSKVDEGAKDGPAKWRRNFVRAMNCIAHKAAAKHCEAVRSGASSVAAASDTGSVAVSMTASAAAKAAAASEKCKALQQRQAECDAQGQPAWDGSTCGAERTGVGRPDCGPDGNGVAAAKGLAATMEDMFRENPEFKHMHSARSMRALLQKATGSDAHRDLGAAELEAVLLLV